MKNPAITFVLTVMAGLGCAQAAENPSTLLAASDTNAQFSLDGKTWSPAVAAWVHPVWPAMKDAKWIWNNYKVPPQEALNGSSIITFRRTFTAKVPGRATLQITADNAYEVSLNGRVFGSHGTLNATASDDQDWRNFDTYDVPLAAGINTLTVRAINYQSPGHSSDPEVIPGGLIFKLSETPTLERTLASGEKAEIYGVHFDIDKYNIKPDSRPVLDEIAALLKKEAPLKVEISGHADSTGDASHNRLLSKQRADAVVAALTRDDGIAPARMTAAGYGDSNPIGSNDSPEGRTQNRRVEIRRIP